MIIIKYTTNMNLKSYLTPETKLIPLVAMDNFLTSGADEFHMGGGGSYGLDDLNDNGFLF